MPVLAKGLADEGMASIRFDFDGHGKSEGRMQDMTIEKELADARAIWEYVKALPYVQGIGLLGHSQGGVIASMTAGRLAAEGSAPDQGHCACRLNLIILLSFSFLSLSTFVILLTECIL